MRPEAGVLGLPDMRRMLSGGLGTGAGAFGVPGYGVSGNGIGGGSDALDGVVSAMAAGVSEAMRGVMVQGAGGAGGDIVIPVYVGGEMIDELVVTAEQRMNLKSGGR